MAVHARRYEVSKRAFDALAAAVLLVVLSPLLLAALLVVWLTMGSPVLFRDTRAGRAGRPFDLLKIRTMRDLRAGETVPESDRARITRVGRALRSTSIDELVSLVNVLRGEMSLVGPRPLPVRYVARYTARQARRLEARPGVTGWAQVNGRNAVGWDERFELDVWYVDHRSLRLDLRILGLTVRQVFSRSDIGHGDHATMPEFGVAEGGRPETPGSNVQQRA